MSDERLFASMVSTPESLLAALSAPRPVPPWMRVRLPADSPIFDVGRGPGTVFRRWLAANDPERAPEDRA